MREILHVRRADADDLPVILGMIDGAAAWLRTKDTDQWARPWPNRAARDARVLRRLLSGDTWIVEEDGSPIATATARRHGNQTLWTAAEQKEPALYISRLVVARHAAGRGIGAAMIDWSGQRAVRDWSAQWVRIDVWTTNDALHDYYAKRGFRFCRIDAKENYPSAALFQKPTNEIDADAAAWFSVVPARAPTSISAIPDAAPRRVAAAPANLAACG
jgi:GNAT superfamily N-acetyltransferase